LYKRASIYILDFDESIKMAWFSIKNNNLSRISIKKSIGGFNEKK